MGGEKTLGVSGWRLRGQRTGVGRYIASLLENFSIDVVRGRFSQINVYTPEPMRTLGIDLPSSVHSRVIRPSLPMLVWENLFVGPMTGDDVTLYPSFSRPFITRHATVVTTHDATMRIVPEMFTRAEHRFYEPLYGWSARAATLVITTTDAAKSDIVREWNVDPDKIRVTPMAAAECFRPLPAEVNRETVTRRLLGSNTPYFLFVGKISGRRNLPVLLRAFAEFKAGGHSHKLVLCGPSYAMETAKALAAECGVDSDVVTVSYVTDDVLNELYNCAEAFIMPSTYENGSLPIFEAQATGTPVVAVDTSGTREITGNVALWIPQLEIGVLAEALNRIATDSILRDDLSRRGLENSRNFSWERCAAETIAICNEAAEIVKG